MLQGEHSAILSTFIKLMFVIKIFVLSIFEWPFYTNFTVPIRLVFLILCYHIPSQASFLLFINLYVIYYVVLFNSLNYHQFKLGS